MSQPIKWEKELHCDVLIIGGGGAAARAAIAAAQAGADTLMVLKRHLGASGATTHKCCEIAGFNVPGSGDARDGADTYLADMLGAGLGMADPALAALLADRVSDRFEDLRRWGLEPATEDGKPIIMKGCYSNYRRGYTIKGHGEPIMRALIGQIRALPIRILEESMAVDLIVEEGRCYGALVLNGSEEFLLVRAGAVILATGGASQIFLNNLNPTDVCGDGYSLAYDHGAALMNMEFMQAGIGFFHPVKSLFNTYLWAGHPELRNCRGELFLEKYLPAGLRAEDVMLAHCRHFPFSSRDESRYLEIAIQKEIENGGGTARMCVPVSFRHFSPEYIRSLEYDADLKQLWPLVVEHFAEEGVDILRDAIEITCVAQAVNGGIVIDPRCMSTIEGLFAAGETAAGPHGADRLGGNMMGACQVFGEIAGREAADFAKAHASAGPIAVPERFPHLELLYRDLPVEQRTRELQELAQAKLFVCRTEEKLQIMLDSTARMKEELASAPLSPEPMRGRLELYHKLNTAQIMASAAIRRRESRGSHYREDYPDRDDENYAAPILLRKEGV